MECLEHVDCSGKAEEEGGQYNKCAELEDWKPLFRMLEVSSSPKPRTPMQHRGMQAMCNALEEQREARGKEFMRVRNLQRQMAPLWERVSLYERLVDAVASRDVQRIASIIHTARRRGFGLKRMVGLLEDAARANRTRYTERECATAVLLYGLARAERELGIVFEVKEGFGLFSPHGTILEVDNKDLQEEDRIDSDEDDEDSDESSVEGADEAEQAFPETSAIAYNGAIVGKQHVLNDLINNSLGKLGHDRLAAALSQPRPSHVLDVPTQAHCENMPIAGDLVARQCATVPSSLWPSCMCER